MTLWLVLYCAAQLWLSYWSDHSEGGDNEYYFYVFFILALSYGGLCYVRGRLVFFQAIECSRALHKDMFQRIIRAPLNLFFDRVPIGRLLNRFSKDLTVIDSQLVQSFNSMLLCSFVLFADFLICGISGTLLVYPLAIVFFKISMAYQEKYMKVQREAYRFGK